MEVVVDAYDASERAASWFGYLESELEFSFTERCATRRAISPLLVGDEVEVVSMAPADECSHEIFVMIRNVSIGSPLAAERHVVSWTEVSGAPRSCLQP